MIEVTILSPREVVFSGQAESVTFPGEQGVFEVRSFHRSLVSRLLPGMVIIDRQWLGVRRGIVRVAQGSVTAIVEPDEA